MVPSVDSVQDESMPVATDFLAEVVRDWEAGPPPRLPGGGPCLLADWTGAFSQRRCSGQVGAPVPPRIRFLLAPGTQWQSWIHGRPDGHDPAGAIEHRLEGSQCGLAQSVAQREFSRTLARVLRRPHVPPAVPRFAIQLLYGEGPCPARFPPDHTGPGPCPWVRFPPRQPRGSHAPPLDPIPLEPIRPVLECLRTFFFDSV